MALEVFQGFVKSEGQVSIEGSLNFHGELLNGTARWRIISSTFRLAAHRFFQIRARLWFQYQFPFLNFRSRFLRDHPFSKLFPTILGATACSTRCISLGLLPNLRCTGQHELFNSWNVHPSIYASCIFKGRISKG